MPVESKKKTIRKVHDKIHTEQQERKQCCIRKHFISQVSHAAFLKGKHCAEEEKEESMYNSG